MADLTPSGREIDARSQALVVRKLELRVLELRTAIARGEIDIQEFEDKIARRQEGLQETRAALAQVEQQIVKEKSNG